MTKEAIIDSGEYPIIHRLDDNFPHLIFLSAVLDTAIPLLYDGEPAPACDKKAVASMAAWLADKIEDGIIPIYQVVTMLPLGRAERDSILLRLRSSDIQELTDDVCESYYIGGKELYIEIGASSPNIANIKKGGVWAMLTIEGVPSEWKVARSEVKVEVLPDINPNYVDWKTPAQFIADELFDHDTKLSTRDTLLGYSNRVMDEMQKRGIHGARGRIDNPKTIMREALQGSKWWNSKSK